MELLCFAVPAVAPVAVLHFQHHFPLYHITFLFQFLPSTFHLHFPLPLYQVTFLFIILYLNIITWKFTLQKCCLLFRQRPILAFYCNKRKPVYWVSWSCFPVLSYLLTSCAYQYGYCALCSHESHSTEKEVNRAAARATILPSFNVRISMWMWVG